MKRGLRPEELRIWAVVASTVRPAVGRSVPEVPPESPRPPVKAAARPKLAPAPILLAPVARPKPRPIHPFVPDIEPGRKRRLVRERDILEFRLDLHGLDQDRAKLSLIRFLIRAQDEGERAVLVITGKGTRGEGVLRRFAPEWLGDGQLRTVVAGWSQAHRKHGGEGALYVALKRRAEG